MKFGIARKVIFLSVNAIVVFDFLLGFYFVRHEMNALNQELDERAKVILSGMVSAAEYPLLIKDPAGLSKVLKDAAAQKDVIHCRIDDKSGKALAEEGGKGQGLVRTFDAPVYTQRIEANGGGPVERTEEMIVGGLGDSREVIGKVELAVSLAGLEKRLWDVKKTVALVVVGAVFLTSLSIALLLHFILDKPIESLVEATGKIAEGDLGHRVPLRSDDEIGILARSFNRMTENLKASSDELKKADERLLESRKLAAVGQLASRVGHELRNPLGSVRNALYYLRDALKGEPVFSRDPSIGEFLSLAETEIDEGTQTIVNLIDYSEAIRLEVERVHVNVVLAGALSSVDAPPAIAVVRELDDNIPQVPMDPGKVHRLFVHLIRNAVEAMPKGGVLRLVTAMEPDRVRGGFWIEVKLIDTGVGIVRENLQRVFEPMFTTKVKGSGLGLAIALGIARAHGGSISVESQPGKGSAFTVRLPGGGPPS